MEEYGYIRTGTHPDAEPACTPYARGLFIVLKRNFRHEEVTDEEYMKINLHAQQELASLSPVFEKVQKHWSTLPHTPARQLDNMVVTASEIEDAEEDAQEWIKSFTSVEGLVYIFSIEREINLQTGETFRPLPVTAISFGMGGMSIMSGKDDDLYMKYRVYFAYAEK